MFQFPEFSNGGRSSPTGKFLISFRQEMVKLLEQGVPSGFLCSTYKIPQVSLLRWRLKYGTKRKLAARRQVHPVHKRRSIARAIASGQLTPKQAVGRYHIAFSTIKSWLQKYTDGNGELYSSINRQMRKKITKQQKGKPANDEVTELKQKLADAELKIAALDTLIDVAEDQLKITIRKKPGARQS
jgi:transposase-like protein